MFCLIKEGDNRISGIDDWPRPRKEDQWSSGRSAMEFARYWTESHLCGTIPPDYTELLCPAFPGIELHVGQPEFPTSLPPKGSRGPRIHDLHLWGTWHSGSLTVCVEAKADESFEETIGKNWTEAKKTLASNQSSLKKRRLEDLLECVWGVRQPTASLSKLRYQLLHGLVGTAIQACIDSKSAGDVACGTGVFLIHVFETGKTERKKLKQNQQDLVRFVHALPYVSISTTEILPGYMYGPATVNVPAGFPPLSKAKPVNVYLAEIVTVLH